MSENRASDRSVVTRSTDKSHVSDSMAPSGYEADDERGISLSADGNHSNLSGVNELLNSPSTPRAIIEAGNAINMNFISPATNVQAIRNIEEVDDNEDWRCLVPVANLLSGDKLSNNTKNNHGAVVEEESFIRSRSPRSPDRDQSSDKRRRLAFE